MNSINDFKKNAVIMPGEVAEFLVALSVVTRMSAVSSDEIILIIEEHLGIVCKVLSPFSFVICDAHGRHEIDAFNKLVKENVFETVFDLSTFAAHSRVHSKLNCRKIISLTEELNRKSGMVSDVRKHLSEDYSYVCGIDASDPHHWPGITIDADPEYEGMVVLCPGTVRGAGRNWPYYSELIKYLSSEEFVILGDENDLEICKKLAPRLPHRVRNLAGKISLEKAAHIIAGSSMVISNDSGFLHLAGYIGVLSVGLFGSSSPVRRRPLGAHSNVVYADILCSPCDMEVCNGLNLECMTRLSVERVIDVINSLSA
ncbi:MAG: glycosyltransferase family 9 protein [Chitinispirillaceae bacterium]|nr:glycosyltransferase family 9 protein [Chitinispirillaceae bacterium]